MCQCPYGLNFISTKNVNNSKSESNSVSMPSRTKLHFYHNMEVTEWTWKFVSMPSRAKLHSYPTPSKNLYLCGLLSPFLHIFFRIFWKQSFSGAFLCLAVFSSSSIEFHLLCNDILSFLFSILIQFPSSVNIPYSFL